MSYSSIDVAVDKIGEIVPTEVEPVRTDDISNIHVQVVKVMLGAEGVNDGLLSAVNLESAEVTANENAVTVNSAASTRLLAANANRKGGWIQVDADTTLWVSLTTDAAEHTGTRIDSYSHLELPAGFRGEVSGYQTSGAPITVLATEFVTS